MPKITLVTGASRRLRLLHLRWACVYFLCLVMWAALIPNMVYAQAEQSPEQVVQELLDAMHINDAERIRLVFAEQASQAYGSEPEKSGDKFFAWLESDIIASHGRVDNNQLSKKGEDIVVTERYRNNNNYQSDANFLMTVEDDKITYWHIRY